MDADSKQRLIDRMEAIPITSTLRFRLEDLGEGMCRASVPYEKKFDGVYECFHGGLLMTIADSIACFAVLTQAGPDQALTTTDMNIRFLAPCLTDVTAEAKVIKLGRTLCPVGVELWDATGKPVAVAQVNYMRLPGVPHGER